MATKTTKVKWALDDPGELQEFESNDEIMARNKFKLPPKGVARLRVVRVQQRKNKNDEPSMNLMLAIDVDKKHPAYSWNGLTLFEWLNVTQQGAPFVKRFLNALGVTWGEFQSNTKADKLEDPPIITNIGKVKFDGPKPVYVWAVIKPGEDRDGNEQAQIGRFIPPRDESVDDEVEDEDEAEDMDDVVVEDDDDDDDEEVEVDEDDDSDEDDDDEDDEEDDDEDEEDDEDVEEALRAELKALKIPALTKRALRAGADADDVPDKKGALIDLIVSLELEDDDDEEDEDEDEDEEDVNSPEYLQALSVADLKARCVDNGRSAKELKKAGKDKAALIEMIQEDEDLPPF